MRSRWKTTVPIRQGTTRSPRDTVAQGCRRSPAPASTPGSAQIAASRRCSRTILQHSPSSGGNQLAHIGTYALPVGRPYCRILSAVGCPSGACSVVVMRYPWTPWPFSFQMTGRVAPSESPCRICSAEMHHSAPRLSGTALGPNCCVGARLPAAGCQLSSFWSAWRLPGN